MKITFLGTGAAPAYPLPFCRCDNCVSARKLGGKARRKRSSLLINDDLLIDLGPDLMTAATQYGIDEVQIKYWLQTHAHADHFDAGILIARVPEYGGKDLLPIKLLASPESVQKMSLSLKYHDEAMDLADEIQRKRLQLEITYAQVYAQVLWGDYTIVPLPANHGSKPGPLIYAIARGGQALLYATDCGGILDETYTYLKREKWQFDWLVADHTYGLGWESGGHTNADEFAVQAKRLGDEGLLKPGARILGTHISHEGNPPHERDEVETQHHGYEVAFDGMVIGTIDY